MDEEVKTVPIVIMAVSLPFENANSQGLPGMQLTRFDFAAPSFRVLLLDSKPEQLLALVSKKDGVDLAKACNRLAFLSIKLQQPCSVQAQSTSHSIFTMVVDHCIVDKTVKR